MRRLQAIEPDPGRWRIEFEGQWAHPRSVPTRRRSADIAELLRPPCAACGAHGPVVYDWRRGAVPYCADCLDRAIVDPDDELGVSG